jgi:hypothetical protein
MERNLLEREIKALNYEAMPLTGVRWTSSADSEYKAYPAGKLYGLLKEKSFLRDSDFKTKQKSNGNEVYFSYKQKVDVLGEDGNWLEVEGIATYRDKGVEKKTSAKLKGWVKKSWVTVKSVVARGMKLELQIVNNTLWRTDGRKKTKLPRKFGPQAFLHKGAKGKPAAGGKEGSAIELQSEEGGFVEFETPKWFRNWCELKERLQEAVEMTEKMNTAEVVSTSGSSKTVKFPFDIKHLKKGFSNRLSEKETLLVEINDSDWKAKIQVSEAIALSHYESLLREHEAASLVTFTLDKAKEILTEANTAGLPDSRLVNLRGFLQVVVNYIQRGQKVSLIKSGEPSKRHPAKFTFFLMSRTSFSSMFSALLSSEEKQLFREMVDKKIILNKFGLTDTTQFFVDGHGASRTKPTIAAWLKSILKPVAGKDLLSYSPASAGAGGFNGSQAMGRFEVQTLTDKVRFEVRGSVTHGNATGEMIKPARDWVSFTETVFKKAFTDRNDGISGTDLKYDPSKCP